MGTEGDDLREREKLMELISDPGWRRKFLEDPDAALNEKGVARNENLQKLIDALADLSRAELRVVASLNQTLLQAGYKEPDSIVVAKAV